MVQFDVFVNPIVAARRAYPYVVILQSDFAQGVRDHIVAPLVTVGSIPNGSRHLTPLVTLDSSAYLVLVPALAQVRRSDMPQSIGSLGQARSEILAALDYLFFGV